MSAALVELADAIATKVGAIAWAGGAFAVEATYADADELLEAADSEDVKVSVVVPNDYDRIELDTKASTARTATFEVVIRRKFGTSDQDSGTGEVTKSKIDELVWLAELIALSTTFTRLSGYPDAAWRASDHDPLFDRARLRQQRQFFSVTLLTFEIHSAL
jgi:hypothetical protein